MMDFNKGFDIYRDYGVDNCILGYVWDAYANKLL